MFWFLPLKIEEPKDEAKLPLVNGLIIVANVLIFWLGWQPSTGDRGLAGWFSPLTYAFGHNDAWHLIGNMWFLMVFGNPLNRRLGNLLYLLTYLSAALFVGVFAWLLCPSGVRGASGAVFAVIILAGFLFAGRRITIFYFVMFPFSVLAGLVNRPKSAVEWIIRWDNFQARMLWWALLMVPMLELFHLAVWLRFGQWHWSHLGHLAGALFGVIAVLLLPKRVTHHQRSGFAVSSI